MGCVTLEQIAVALSIYTVLNAVIAYLFLGPYFAYTNFLFNATFLVVFTLSLALLQRWLA